MIDFGVGSASDLSFFLVLAQTVLTCQVHYKRSPPSILLCSGCIPFQNENRVYHIPRGQGKLFSNMCRSVSFNCASIVTKLISRSITERHLQVRVYQHFGQKLHLLWSVNNISISSQRCIQRTFITKTSRRSVGSLFRRIIWFSCMNVMIFCSSASLLITTMALFLSALAIVRLFLCSVFSICLMLCWCLLCMGRYVFVVNIRFI